MSNIRPLTTEQRARCATKARERVVSELGDKPHRSQYVNDFEPIVDILDIFAVMAFIAALIKSSMNIILHVGEYSSNIVIDYQFGIIPSPDVYTVLSQVGALLLAEFAMILFVVSFAATPFTRQVFSQQNIIKMTYLVMGLTAAVFVFYANLRVGSNWFESILPPFFTVGIGLRFEVLLSRFLQRRRQITAKYYPRLLEWEKATHNPETHPNYLRYYMQELLQQLSKLKGNEWIIDADPQQKRASVGRELQADQWADQAVTEQRQEELGLSKADQVAQEFVKRPELMDMSLSKLAGRFETSPTTISKAKVRAKELIPTR